MEPEPPPPRRYVLNGLTLIVALGASILVGGVLGSRLGIAPPVLMLACGVLLGFIPKLRDVTLPPEIVLLIFLPALLYWESLNTSLEEIRRALRGVVLMSTLLVVATAAVVAVTAHELGLPWGPAWVLGGAIAPTDATAVAALGRVLPHRNLVLLQAESLLNDGTALVVYGVAVSITVGQEHFSTLHISWLFLRSYIGGAAVGLAVAWAGARVRKRLDDPLLENVAFLLIPFTAFLLAEEIEASGVLAVVVSGLIMSRVGPRVGSPAVRMQAQGFWSLGTFVLNGALFVLIGVQAQSAVRALTSFDAARAVRAVLLVCVVLIAVRFAFQFVAIYAIRALDRRPSQRERRVSHRFRVVTGLAGFRGAVSLAAALAVPETLDSGALFPDRDVIVFVTAGVIAVLMLQAFALPPVVRWARLPEDTRVEEDRRLASTTAAREAFEALPNIAADLGTEQPVVDLLRREYEKHLRVMEATGAEDDGGDGEGLRRFDEQYRALRLAMLGTKRATVLRLRDERRIDDDAVRQIQAKLDIEEVRLSGQYLIE
jgi:monovalent cation/hydrogen antiporter